MRSSTSRNGRWILLLLLVAGCGTTISPYSHTAYQQATSLKARSLRLMNTATGPFASVHKTIDKLETDLAAAREYAAGRPRNQISTRQWDLLLDPNHNLLGGFLKRWQQEKTLSPTFVEEAKRLVADAFDTISGLESGKLGAPSR